MPNLQVPLDLDDRFAVLRRWQRTLFEAGWVGLAWSAESLIVFRVLQGLGGGMILPVGMSVLTQTAGPRRIGRVITAHHEAAGFDAIGWV